MLALVTALGCIPAVHAPPQPLDALAVEMRSVDDPAAVLPLLRTYLARAEQVSLRAVRARDDRKLRAVRDHALDTIDHLPPELARVLYVRLGQLTDLLDETGGEDERALDRIWARAYYERVVRDSRRLKTVDCWTRAAKQGLDDLSTRPSKGDRRPRTRSFKLVDGGVLDACRPTLDVPRTVALSPHALMTPGWLADQIITSYPDPRFAASFAKMEVFEDHLDHLTRLRRSAPVQAIRRALDLTRAMLKVRSVPSPTCCFCDFVPDSSKGRGHVSPEEYGVELLTRAEEWGAAANLYDDTRTRVLERLKALAPYRFPDRQLRATQTVEPMLTAPLRRAYR